MNPEYLDKIIGERLDGDKSRVLELFQNENIIDELNKNSEFGDWFHFETKTYDGNYLVRHGAGFACYYQERGRAEPHEWFKTLNEAANYFFKNAGYING